MERYRIKTRDESDVFLMTRTLSPRCPMFERPQVAFQMHMTGNPRRDYDNQSGLVKGAQDGLVKGGIIEDDSMAVIGKPDIDVVPDTHNFVIIRVSERS